MQSVGKDSTQSWKVLIASFIVRFLLMGLIETAGILMIAIVYKFDVPREEASLPFTLVYCVRNATGPLIGYIGYIIGSRFATLLGCIVSSISVGCCFFAESILTVTVMWGIFLGVGTAFGLLFLNAIIIEHFEKHLAKATGFSGIGIQLGTIFYTLILDYFIYTYGLSGAFLISSGLTLNCIPAALIILFNQPESTHPNMKCSSAPNCIHDPKSSNSKFDSHGAMCKSDANSGKKFHDHKYNIKTVVDQNFTQDTAYEAQKELSKQEIKLNNYQNDESLAANYNCEHEILKNAVIGRKSFSLGTSYASDISPKSPNKQVKELPCYTTEDPYPILKQDIFREEIGVRFDTSSKKVNPSISSESLPETSIKLPKQKHMLIRLFGDEIFLLILVSGGMYYFSSLTFLTILVDYAIDIGIPVSYAKYALVWYSISECIGSLFLGYITDNGWMTCNGFAALCFFSKSMTMVLIIHAQHYIFLAVLITVHQLGVSGLTLNYSSVILESVEKDLISPALASLYVLAAPLSMSVLPLIGYFRDQQGSYVGVFYTIAASELLGCLLHLIILILNNRRKRKVNQKQSQEIMTKNACLPIKNL